MNLADGKPGEKAIATERAPVANIGKCWGGGRGRCITFGLKNDGEGGGAWCECAASVSCELSDQTEQTSRLAWINTRFTPDAGNNGKGGWARCSADA